MDAYAYDKVLSSFKDSRSFKMCPSTKWLKDDSFGQQFGAGRGVDLK